MSMKEPIKLGREKGCEILVSGAHEGIERIFRKSGLLELLGEENFFRHHPENPTISTRMALKRAQQITGIESAEITIFAVEKEKEN